MKRLENAKIIISVSGGKDSTAMVLHMLELGFTWEQMEMVYMDTGWEHASTYQYLEYLESFFGEEITRLKSQIPIHPEHKDFILDLERRIGWESPFIRWTVKKTMFPSRIRKWCTDYLKLQPFKRYVKNLI